jgi:hypothetical protein
MSSRSSRSSRSSSDAQAPAAPTARRTARAVHPNITELREVMDTTPLSAPVIVNPKSNFVVVTYWWGRGNINRNTQYPCAEDVKPERPVTVQAIKYDAMIDDWIALCQRAGCNYLVQEYPQFARPGKYQLAINAKPMFIQRALAACGGRAVVYIDGDMTMNYYPSIFDMKGVDVMARGWNIDPRTNEEQINGESDLSFDPYAFETSGGIMYFADTPQAKHVLALWEELSAGPEMQGKADDRILSLLFALHPALYAATSVVQLPIEYLWLTQMYIYPNGTTYLPEKYWSEKHIMVSHPACLTSEERALDQGAAKERYPKFYKRALEDYVTGDQHGGIFYQSVFFPLPEMAEAHAEYLKYVSETTLYSEKVYDEKVDEKITDYIPMMYVEPYYRSGREPAHWTRRLSMTAVAASGVNRRAQRNFGPYHATAVANIKAAARAAAAMQFAPAPAGGAAPLVVLHEAPSAARIGAPGAQIAVAPDTALCVHPEDAMAAALALLDNGYDVLYVPRASVGAKKVYAMAARTALNASNGFAPDFIAVDKRRAVDAMPTKPQFHRDGAMFFRASATVARTYSHSADKFVATHQPLYYFLAMCADLRHAPSEVFNSSYLFFMQMRCGLVQYTRRDTVVLPEPGAAPSSPAVGNVRALLAPGTCKTRGTPVAPRPSPVHSPRTPDTPGPKAPSGSPVSSPVPAPSAAPVQNHGVGLALGIPKKRTA